MNGGYRKAVKFDPAAVEKKIRIRAEICSGFQRTFGDASDNLKGVAGIGPKTATELIREFGTLENIFANLEKVKPTVRAKLESDRDSAMHSKKMAVLRRDAPLDFDLGNCELAEFEREKVEKLFADLEFFSLARRFAKLFPAKNTVAKKPIEQLQLF